MRKIESDMLSAIGKRKNWKSGNTKVALGTDNSETLIESNTMVEVFLFGNLIARYVYRTEKLMITDDGYQTATTKSRLNALLSKLAPSYGIFQRDFAFHLMDSDGVTHEWPSNEWVVFRSGELSQM